MTNYKKEEGKKGKRKWILYSVILVSLIVVGVFISLYLVNVNIRSTYTWEDRSSGECEVVEGIYFGKANTLYLHDDLIDAFCSARFSYDALTEGSVSFHFRYDSDVSGDITMEFYMGNTMFSTIDSIQDSALISNRWYVIELKFDCADNTGEVWIDGYFLISGDFTISDADYNDGFVIKTDSPGMINAYISMISIA